MKSRPSKGFTLLELLVAMTILVILGGALVTILNGGVRIWHTAEKRGAIYDRARTILDQIAEDLRSAAGDSRAEGPGLWVRFIGDADGDGLPRLRFTRAIVEAQDPVLREGGKNLEIVGDLYADLHGDGVKARDGKLLPPGGYEEVLYAMDPEPGRPVLWRGIRSPPGGAGSLFIDRNIEEDPARARERERARKSAAKTAPQENDEAFPQAPSESMKKSSSKKGPESHPLTLAARPFAEDVLHLSFAFWTPFTTTWDRTKPTRLGRTAVEESGPLTTWDSTRATLDEKAGSSGEFAWRRIEGSLENPYDDLFPERVEVTLVVAGSAEVRAAVLAEGISSSDKNLVLTTTEGLPAEGPDRFLWIEGEWIGYDKIEGPRVQVSSAKGIGRGARGTKPAPHVQGSAVDPGTTFRRVVEIPAARVDAFPGAEKERRRRP